jgi:hypothetical protein
MSAIDMLESQHREVEELFEDFEEAPRGRKHDIFLRIADKLAVHAAIEEKHFYPAARTDDTEDLVLEAVEEHLAVKRMIADLLRYDAVDGTFEAKMKLLREEVDRHVAEEEAEIFPRVEDILDDITLDAVEQEMMSTEEDLLAKGHPRDQVPGEAAAPI